ncbi:MAG: hypothetical protein HYU46_08035 [Deltaproteobacteria bacterium]|nr:hypothetical protein [Deltaproteobacteria bacterium]
MLALALYLWGWPSTLYAQSPRQIKVLLESQQLVDQNRQAAQGSGSVIIRKGTVQPSGRLGAVERQTSRHESSAATIPFLSRLGDRPRLYRAGYCVPRRWDVT